MNQNLLGTLLLEPLKAVNGAPMIGASTATPMVAFQAWIQQSTK